jgi:hypothetical protein
LLSSKGIIYIEVPNVDFWWYKLPFTKGDFAYDNLNFLHIWCFSKESLLKMLKRHSLKVEEVTTFTMEQPIPNWLKRRLVHVQQESQPIPMVQSAWRRKLGKIYRNSGKLYCPFDMMGKGAVLRVIASNSRR